MTASRFDNLPTQDLRDRFEAAEREWEELEAALTARLLAESPVKLGKTYRVKPNTVCGYGGRTICIRYLRVERGWHGDRLELVAEGVLKRPTITRNGYFRGAYTSKHVSVLPEFLDLSSEGDAPKERWPHERHDFDQ